MKKQLFIGSTTALLLMAACQKVNHEPLYEATGIPGTLTNTKVENLPGAANISYTLPEDDGVAYVLAEFEIRPGVKREEKASLYKNFVRVEGFSDTIEYAVKLTVVSKSEEKSQPITVTVKPLLPPYIATFRSLLVKEDWGGLNIAFANDEKADLVITTLTDTTDNQFEGFDNYYTKLQTGAYSLRGFDSVDRKFGFYVKDKFGNISDTMIKTLKPLYEKMLDKSLFRERKLPGDVDGETNWGDMTLPRIWDKDQEGWAMWHSKPHDKPMWFTFDLGVTAQLSRMAIWQRQDDNSYMFNGNNVKNFEVWGSTAPNPDGSWDASWTKLIDVTVTKPSGSPLGTLTQDDLDAIEAGYETNIPISAPRVRYIRIKILETFLNNSSAANISELSFWGQP